MSRDTPNEDGHIEPSEAAVRSLLSFITRTLGWHACSDGEGGITLHRRSTAGSVRFEIDAAGAIERLFFVDSKLVERELAGDVGKETKGETE